MPLEKILCEAMENSKVYRNIPAPKLIESSLTRKESSLTNSGALLVSTGKYTGRSPNDKFFVQDPSYNDEINWGKINQPMSTEHFNRIRDDVLDYLSGKELYVNDGYAGADSQYRLSIRVINELAWQNLFIHQLLVRPNAEELLSFQPTFHIICAPGFKTDPAVHGTNSEVVVAVNLKENLIIIAGSAYAGEIKKSVFTLMNYLLPKQNVLSMHCSANVGKKGDVALFFGLSGTGKTSLSADPDRFLIGDDEHGWSKNGIFNIEGGCYAKCINLSPIDEPQIWNAIRFGSVLENVVCDELTCTVDFSSPKITENTRLAYPVDYIPNPVISGIAGHPQNIFFLTADAFGVLPPIARLNKDQAMYHFLSGYTSKLAGTERGIEEPQATFSECFGSPFLPLAPIVYANMLGQKLSKYGSRVYLVNTGWTGGPYGVGSRFKIAHTRAIIKAALEGQLDNVSYRKDPIFGFEVPEECPGIPVEILTPQTTWPDPEEYDKQAVNLAQQFLKNFQKFNNIPENILKVAPTTYKRSFYFD